MNQDPGTFSEMQKIVGKVVCVGDGNGCWYDAKILDAKMAFGQVRFLVAPVAGYGKKWVMTFVAKHDNP